MIKICFVSPFAYPLFNPDSEYVFGGSEVRAVIFGKTLSKQAGFEVSFAVFDHGQRYIEQYDNIRVYTDSFFGRQKDLNQPRKITTYKRILNGVLRRFRKFVPSPTLTFFDKKIPRNKFKTYNQIDADVYCTFGVSNLSAYISFFCLEFNKRHVLFLGSGSDLQEDYILNPAGKNVYGSSNELCFYSLKNARKIIAQNNEQKNQLLKIFKRESVLIKNPIDLEQRIKKNVCQDNKEILWVGKSNTIKQPYLLLKVAYNFPEINFTMIMNRSDVDIYEEVLKGSPTNVTIIPSLPLSEIEKYFARAYVFINTSVFEGFPNTFLQAGKYSVPILSLNVDPDNFISDYKCGLCAQGDLERLVFGLKSILSDSTLHKTLSKNLWTYVKKEHDLANITPELKILLQNSAQ